MGSIFTFIDYPCFQVLVPIAFDIWILEGSSEATENSNPDHNSLKLGERASNLERQFYSVLLYHLLYNSSYCKEYLNISPHWWEIEGDIWTANQAGLY